MNRIGGKICHETHSLEVHFIWQCFVVLFHRKSKYNTRKKSAALSTSDDDNSEKENFENDSDVLFEWSVWWSSFHVEQTWQNSNLISLYEKAVIAKAGLKVNDPLVAYFIVRLKIRPEFSATKLIVTQLCLLTWPSLCTSTSYTRNGSFI